MRIIKQVYGLLLCAVLYFPVAHADQLMMIRSLQDFPDAMSTLQESIIAHGYSLTRVQRVDIGLTGFGYQTDKYRIVFFSKYKEVEKLTERYPEIAAYLPLKMVLFAEENQTLVTTSNPLELAKYFTDPEAVDIFRRWQSDLYSILADVHAAE